LCCIKASSLSDLGDRSEHPAMAQRVQFTDTQPRIELGAEL
jgi:hypothetical protein